MKFENQYGRLEIKAISLVQDIAELKSVNFPKECFFDLETAEKVALITQNKSIQIAFSKDQGTYRGALLLHAAPSKACLCQIVAIDFTADCEPSEELARWHRFNAMTIM